MYGVIVRSQEVWKVKRIRSVALRAAEVTEKLADKYLEQLRTGFLNTVL